METRSAFRKRVWKKSRKLSIDGMLSCYYCGKTPLFVGCAKGRPLDRRATIDHIVPISSGGDAFNISNTVICCYKCNEAKANLSQEQFLASDWLKARRLEVSQCQTTV